MAVFSNHLMYNTHPFPITGVIVVVILCVISAYYHYKTSEFKSRLWRDVLDTTIM